MSKLFSKFGSDAQLIAENDQLREELSRIRTLGGAEKYKDTLDHISLLATTLASRLSEREDRLHNLLAKQAVYIKIAEDHLRMPRNEWASFHLHLRTSDGEWEALPVPWGHISTDGSYRNDAGVVCEVRICSCGELLARYTGGDVAEKEEDEIEISIEE